MFPINLDQARLSYEVPFGTVEIGKDEMDFSLLPPDNDTQFTPAIYGGDHPLTFREAINWIDASSPDYSERAAWQRPIRRSTRSTTNPKTRPSIPCCSMCSYPCARAWHESGCTGLPRRAATAIGCLCLTVEAGGLATVTRSVSIIAWLRVFAIQPRRRLVPRSRWLGVTCT